MDEKARKSYNDVEAVDILHQVSNFISLQRCPMIMEQVEAYTSVEVHTLKHIADHHGITVTEPGVEDQGRSFPNPEKGGEQGFGIQGSGP